MSDRFRQTSLPAKVAVAAGGAVAAAAPVANQRRRHRAEIIPLRLAPPPEPASASARAPLAEHTPKRLVRAEHPHMQLAIPIPHTVGEIESLIAIIRDGLHEQVLLHHRSRQEIAENRRVITDSSRAGIERPHATIALACARIQKTSKALEGRRKEIVTETHGKLWVFRSPPAA